MSTMVENGGNFAPKGQMARKLRKVALVAAALLLVPAVAMQFTREVTWGPGDFVVAFLLLGGTGAAYVVLSSKLSRRVHRVLVGALLGLALLLIWAELAVGVFS
jgi:hypothetical protein